MKTKTIYTIIILLLTLSLNSVYAQRGCCSHHGGVAGCSDDGRQICSDGELSPTCTCTSVKSSTSTKKYIYGCTDSSAKNYNLSAEVNDGSCIYESNSYKSIDTNLNEKDLTIEDNSSFIYVLILIFFGIFFVVKGIIIKKK